MQAKGRSAGVDSGPRRETEIKLQIDPRHLRRLQRAGWFKGIAPGHARVRKLDATYFDTVDFKLREAGLTLRVRKEGHRYVQSVKARGRRGVAFTREELETVVPGGMPNPAAAGDLSAERFFARLKREDLVPVFRSRVRRVRRELMPARGNRIAIDIDVGEIRAGENCAPICEVEFELLAGEPRHLYELALKLIEEVPARFSTDAKSDRGYALLTGREPDWRKASPLVLDPKAPVDDALVRMIVNGVEHLQTNEACALARSHIEGIHQMRVALRRLRSALAIYKSMLPGNDFAELTGELKWLIGELGPARDWDVFIADVLESMDHWQGDDAGLKRLREEAAKCRDDAYTRAHGAIQDNRYTRLLLRLVAWAEERPWRARPVVEEAVGLYGPTLAFADQLIERNHRKLLKAGKHLKDLSDDERHRFRIRIKKQRYAVEFFQSLYPRKKTADYRGALAGLQDGLGGLNDLAVARALLAEIARSADGDGAGELGIVGGMVMGWHARVAQDHLKGVYKTWKRLARLKPFWTQTKRVLT